MSATVRRLLVALAALAVDEGTGRIFGAGRDASNGGRVLVLGVAPRAYSH